MNIRGNLPHYSDSSSRYGQSRVPLARSFLDVGWPYAKSAMESIRRDDVTRPLVTDPASRWAVDVRLVDRP